MFDWIRCEYPLPEGAPTDDYQTKDTPEQWMARLVIREDGSLVNEQGDVVPFHGALEFYASNVTGSCPAGYVTRDDKPAEHWSFVALYDHGKLLKMEGGKEDPDEFYGKPPMARADFHAWRPSRPRDDSRGER